MATTSEERLAVKTPEAAFRRTLEEEYHFAPRIARDLMALAQEMLVGTAPASTVRPGQVRLVVASVKAPFGPPLRQVDKVEVTLTVDAGQEDAEVKRREGAEGLRRGQILRLLAEALDQGGVLTQEDLARVLRVGLRTIRRDMAALKAEGHDLHTRGQLKGVGRGQTHKVRILTLWLEREGYDAIARRMHHSPQAIQRYVSAFLRVVALQQQGTAEAEIAFLTQSSRRLVADYLAVYQVAQTQPHQWEKLEEELARVGGGLSSPVGGEKTPGRGG